MKTLKLVRVSYSDDAAFGVLIDDKIPFCLTLERPWLDNQTNISCIPAGTYLCKRVDSPRFGDTFEVTNVPGRTHILFHKGNIADDTHGCIIAGEEFGHPTLGEEALKSSGHAYKEFMSKLEGVNQFALIIS